MNELLKYTNSGKFSYRASDILSKVCNAPENGYGGIYVIYSLKGNQRELVYIGISGRIDKITGKLVARKDGIRGRIVKGKRDGKPRKDFWLDEMKINRIESLEINWFVVHDENSVNDCPATLEDVLIKKYRPRWNRT
jgi:hypothetical protein